MKRIIKLTESQLRDIVKKVISEQTPNQNIISEQLSQNQKTLPKGVPSMPSIKDMLNPTKSNLGPVGNPTKSRMEQMPMRDAKPKTLPNGVPSMPSIKDMLNPTKSNLGPVGNPVQTPSGTVQKPSGTVQKPSGTVQKPSGTVQTPNQERIDIIANIMSSVKDGIIVNPSSKMNKRKWIDFVTTYKVTPEDIKAANNTLAQRKTAQGTQNQRYVNIANVMKSVDPTTTVIKSTNAKLNGMSWVDYITKYKVTQDDINKAQTYVAGLSNIDTLKKASTPDPKVTELQKQLKAAGYDLGLTGPNKDGIDGIMGSKTRAAQQKQALDKMKQMGSDYGNAMNNTIKDLSQLTPQQQATADALSKKPNY